MSATINTGWLKGKNGVKFAPKTLSSQVITNDGIALEEKIAADLNEIKTYIDETVSGNEGSGSHDHNDTYYTEAEIDSMLSTTASTIKNDLLNGAGEAYDTLKELGELIDENTDAIEALELIAAAKMDKNDPVGTGSFSLNRKTGSNVGLYSFTEGSQNIASSYAAHAEGSENSAYSYAAHAEGWKTTASGDYSHSEGQETTASGYAAHAEGYNTKATAYLSHAEGNGTIASGSSSHAEGYDTKASGDQSHAEGGYTEATGYYSHAEGHQTKAYKDYSHAEGTNTLADGYQAHAEGSQTQATGTSSHAEGQTTEATAFASHAEGQYTKATGSASHSEGSYTEATYSQAHAEGNYTKATGQAAHAEGTNTIASGGYSHAEGEYTKAASYSQHVQGKYNIEDANGIYAHIVGNGNSTTASNAHTLDWQGNAWYAGSMEATSIILSSPNGTRFSISVGDDGILTATEITTE